MKKKVKGFTLVGVASLLGILAIMAVVAFIVFKIMHLDMSIMIPTLVLELAELGVLVVVFFLVYCFSEDTAIGLTILLLIGIPIATPIFATRLFPSILENKILLIVLLCIAEIVILAFIFEDGLIEDGSGFEVGVYVICSIAAVAATIVLFPKYSPTLLQKVPLITASGDASVQLPINAEINAGIGVGNDFLSPENNNVSIGNHDNTTVNNYYVTADGSEISGALLFNKVETKFEYSSDNGETWKERISNFNIGSTYYVTVSMKVSQSVKTDTEQIIHADIIFPDTEANQINVEEAQGLKDWEGQLDEETHTITYPIEMIAGVDPAEFSVVFAVKPSKNGTFPVSVVYDNQINENWDKTVNLKYGTN